MVITLLWIERTIDTIYFLKIILIKCWPYRYVYPFYTIGPFLNHLFGHYDWDLAINASNLRVQGINPSWLICVNFRFRVTPKKIIQRCDITLSRTPAQNMKSLLNMSNDSRAVWLVASSYWNQISLILRAWISGSKHSVIIAGAIDDYVTAILIFEEIWTDDSASP